LYGGEGSGPDTPHQNVQLGNHIEEVEIGEILHQLPTFCKDVLANLGGVQPREEWEVLFDKVVEIDVDESH
jgi:hypothetical protein